MKISTKGRYALRIMMDLANNENDEFISLKDISKRINISIKYLEQIVALLNKAGYVQTARGNAQKPFIILGGDFSLQGQQPFHSLPFFGIRSCIRHIGSLCSAAFGIDKCI